MDIKNKEKKRYFVPFYKEENNEMVKYTKVFKAINKEEALLLLKKEYDIELNHLYYLDYGEIPDEEGYKYIDEIENGHDYKNSN